MEERLSRLEVLVEYHEKMISSLQSHVEVMNHELGKVKEELASIRTSIDNMKKDIAKSNRWAYILLGIFLTAANVITNIIIAALHP